MDGASNYKISTKLFDVSEEVVPHV